MSTIRITRSAQIGLLILLSFFGIQQWALAQSAARDTTETGQAETSIELTFKELNNQHKLLTATVKTKVADAYVGVNGVTVNFYQGTIDPASLLGSAVSNGKGIASFIVPADKLSSKMVDYTFVAAIEDNEKYVDNSEEIAASESDFVMTLEQGDSSRQVLITLRAPNAKGEMEPVAEAEVHLYVQRLFGLLPLSSEAETTDEEGTVSVDFPIDIPGDTAGNLIIVARVEDHEKYGNLEFQRKINWGIPLIIDHGKTIRELWSSRANAPLYLIFIVNTILIGIWGVIGYIIFEVFKIWKIGRQKTA